MASCSACGSPTVVGGLVVCPEATRGQPGHEDVTAAYCDLDLVVEALLGQQAGTLVTVVAEEVMHGALREFGVTVPILTAAQIVDELVAEFRRELDAV